MPTTGADTIDADTLVSLEAQVREASRLLQQGDTEAALATLSPLTSDEVAYLPARFLLAMTAWKMGRLDWSNGLVRQCHELWPMDGTVAEVLASLYALAGNLGEALFMGKMGAALGGPGDLSHLVPPGFPIFDSVFYSIKERPLLAQARSNLRNGRIQEAVDKAKQHVALDPQDGDGQAFFATALLRAGSASVAVDTLRPIAAHVELPASCASLYARALAAVGDAAEARRWHEKAAALAPDDADITAARVADSTWLDENPAQFPAAEEWVRRFCPATERRQWQRGEGKLIIGYFVPAFADPQDAAAVAAVARAHDRARVTVVGYCQGAQVWPENAGLRGAFDAWHDIGTLDPVTLARFFARGGCHVIVDAAGFAAPRGLMALARLETAIRVAWLGNSAGIGTPVYDAQIAAKSAAPMRAAPWHVTGGYPILPAQKRMPRGAHGGIQFGADIRLAQLDGETVRLWTAVLQAQPEAKLLLRANDMGRGGNIERLIARFGRELAARIDIVEVDRMEAFYAGVDVALTPCRGVSPRMAAEALTCGVPPVALEGANIAQPYAAFLRDLGLGSMLVAADDGDYASIASGLATSPGPREQVAAAMTAAAASAGEDCARRFARTLEDHTAKALELAEGMSS